MTDVAGGDSGPVARSDTGDLRIGKPGGGARFWLSTSIRAACNAADKSNDSARFRKSPSSS
jgi:hypothetical protein